MEILLWILFAFGVLYGLDQLGLWMEAKGWIYYRKTKRKPGGGGDILTGFGFMEPGTRHLQDAREERVLEDEDDGDDAGKRKSGDRTG